MNDLRTAAQQALEALEYGQHSLKQVSEYQWESRGELAMHALRAALAQQAEAVLQTCNCRWDGEVQVQQCTLHEAHVDAIHEWAERAKVAERKLAQQAEPVEPVAEARYDGTLRWLEPHGVGLHRIQGPLYTAPPQRKPLTDEEILRVKGQFKGTMNAQFVEFARAVERAHGIGGPE